MKLKALLFILFLLLCAISGINAQVSEGGQPYSFIHQVSTAIEACSQGICSPPAPPAR